MLDLQTISDRIEIDDLLTRYTRAIDTGHWDGLDEVFTPDARIDYTDTGGLAGGYPEVKRWLAENLPLFPRRQHARPEGGGPPRRPGGGHGVLPEPDGARRTGRHRAAVGVRRLLPAPAGAHAGRLAPVCPGAS